MWFTPDIEQAGAQHGRGCIEQILTLRLLIDSARASKKPLYVLFVDFKKAYDLVPRSKLLRQLALFGCGKRMLLAIARTLDNTLSRIGNEVFEAKIGVRQGGSSSSFLFVFFVNPLIRTLKSCAPDSWIKDLHVLMLMDDTVIFATTRESMQHKIHKLCEFCAEFDMTINQRKTKFIGINTPDNDPFLTDGLIIEETSSYVYLGSTIMNASLSNQIANEIKLRTKHGRKFSSFISAHRDAPFAVKRKVWDAAVVSAVLYGCETWWTSDIKSAATLYMSTIKQLLGVRSQTSNDLTLMELELPSLSALVKKRQRNFFCKYTNRSDYNMTPMKRALDIAIACRSPMSKYFTRNILTEENSTDPIHEDINQRRITIQTSGHTRMSTYICMNPNLTISNVYTSSPAVPEYMRIIYSKFRLSSHRLMVETGRWSRIPRENRLCDCGLGQVQDEQHVLCDCPQTADIRNSFPNIDFNMTAIMKINNASVVVQIISNVMSKYNK